MKITIFAWIIALAPFAAISSPSPTPLGPLFNDSRAPHTPYETLSEKFSLATKPSWHPGIWSGRCFRRTDPRKPSPAMLGQIQKEKIKKTVLHVPAKDVHYFDSPDQSTRQQIDQEIEKDWKNLAPVMEKPTEFRSTFNDGEFFAEWNLRQSGDLPIVQGLTPDGDHFLYCYFFEKLNALQEGNLPKTQEDSRSQN